MEMYYPIQDVKKQPFSSDTIDTLRALKATFETPYFSSIPVALDTQNSLLNEGQGESLNSQVPIRAKESTASAYVLLGKG